MKKLILAITATLLWLPIFSQQMIIEKSDSYQTVAMEQLRRITFNGNNVNVTQNDGTTITAAMGEINRIYFGTPTSIDNLAGDSNEFITAIGSNAIAVNCPAGEVINIYSINGVRIISTRQEADGGNISIEQLPHSIYLIEAAGRTAKFIKR